MLTTAPRELVEGELAVHLLPDDEGRFRYRYCQSAVVAAYGEMTREPPPFEQVRIPTLLVLGETSYIPYDHLLDAHAAALGDLLQVDADRRRAHGALGRARRHAWRRRALPRARLGLRPGVGAAPVDHGDGLVADDPCVVARRQHADLSRPDLELGPVCLADPECPGDMELEVRRLAELRAGDRLARAPTSSSPAARCSGRPRRRRSRGSPPARAGTRGSRRARRTTCASISPRCPAWRSSFPHRRLVSTDANLLVGKKSTISATLGPCRPRRHARHADCDPRYRRAARAAARLQRLQLRRCRRRARPDEGRPPLSLRRQGGARRGADEQLHAALRRGARADRRRRVPGAGEARCLRRPLRRRAQRRADVPLRHACGRVQAPCPRRMQAVVLRFFDENERWLERVLEDGRHAPGRSPSPAPPGTRPA